ncbi:DUF4174 domain-containing protein [Thalassotalea sp. HSM 43]|uniref:DUF4174 domain-containing protein n=1 Tax=Thalassotalea sp. HSM 43 TaxID=2552945 RepID=UPI00108191F9|nr:DUF4174 domain-containing protein [Thalassotalea sp. HSM 43]QBY03554.1 DUF4174 domain-containing protein [Thalassotalea sp. HSM 43]
MKNYDPAFIAAVIALVMTLLNSKYSLAQDSISEAMLWQHRLLIFNVDNKQQLPQIDTEIRDEFNLQIITLIDTKAYLIDSNDNYQQLSAAHYSELSKNYSQAQHAWLIGLDGGVKANYPIDSFDLDAVASLINTMPMRQRQLQQQ